ncbi:MAG: hypothetical protein CMP12_07845 [Zunongwangia sp.]|uniref:Uncharacterized protein n=1 Tax=Zunongwangia profunda (strain DSM 18752 / CCTCC AB 206139 / SM-A87) TaxID=655815 RepID=D5BIW6_ZUNPS|nr:hypothetical protein [Zunongwangia profunda]ADF53599.1 conserved hypothetical protein [Zunongwangia profunda SM-A87]MAO35810.1 hypothetical protein [Zunongwangia sp.]MAS71303.1 hypothetical protein [Zunongwangia sp.]|tara:strand:+ start:28 stop:219 length:192 start_codon:yes stop_codon:yes gene_type:complete
MTIEEIHKIAEKCDLKGTTVNERLYISGLLNEFDKAMIMDKPKAREILKALKVDENSIEKIVS